MLEKFLSADYLRAGFLNQFDLPVFFGIGIWMRLAICLSETCWKSKKRVSVIGFTPVTSHMADPELSAEYEAEFSKTIKRTPVTR